MAAQASQSPSLEGTEQADEDRWRRWVDERLVRLLTVNIYRNMRESFQTFDYITASSCNFGFFEREAARLVGALMMWGISGRLKKKYDIEGDVREELYQAANTWIDGLGDQRCAVHTHGRESALKTIEVQGTDIVSEAKPLSVLGKQHQCSRRHDALLHL